MVALIGAIDWEPLDGVYVKVTFASELLRFWMVTAVAKPFGRRLAISGIMTFVSVPPSGIAS
jgi:hypothetical protein